MGLKLGNGVIISTSGAPDPVTGFLLPIGDPNTGDGDGSLDDGAIPLDENMSVSNAIDKINEFMLKLVPAAPTLFPNGTLVESGYTVGLTPLLCSGAIPDNTSGGTLPSVVAGGDASPYRGTSAIVDSNTLVESGYGDTGSIYVSYNNIKGGELFFTTNTGDSINSGSIEVTNNNWFPISQPNFHQSFDAKVNDAPALDGWNRYSLTYVDADVLPHISDEFYVIKDNLTNTASFTSGALSESIAGTLALSSGINHYQTGAVLLMAGATINDLSGYTYTSSDPLEISSIGGTLTNGEPTVDYTSLGIATPLSVGTTGQLVSYDITLDEVNSHAEDNLRFRVRNTNGYGNYVDVTAINVLYMDGVTSNVDESAIVAPTSNAYRVDLGLGATLVDAPAVNLPATPTVFNSTQLLNDVSYTSEAAVVGGTLKHDVRDYTAGFMPAGPDYTNKKADSQYIDIVLSEESLSNITINIQGTYSGLWIGLEDYSEDIAICPNSINGTWWDGFVAYNGSGLPARAGASAGCAEGLVPTGTSGSYVMTFGTANTSKNSNGTDSVTPKNIYVRLKLSAGQSITSLSFG